MINIIIILSLFSRTCTDKAPVEFFIFTFHTIQKIYIKYFENSIYFGLILANIFINE